MDTDQRTQLLRELQRRVETTPVPTRAAGTDLYREIRGDIERSGATPDDCAYLAERLICWLVESSGLFTEEMKHAHLALIAELLPGRRFTVHTDRGRGVSVVFADSPRTH